MTRMGKGIPWAKVAATAGGAFAVETIAFAVLLMLGVSLWPLLVAVSACYLIFSVFAIVQLLYLRREPNLKPDPRHSMSATVIVAAYLPNEAGIIVDTVLHMLTQVDRPRAGFELILAYNTPKHLPIEAQLRALEREFPEFRALHVASSHSKAENVNAAVAQARGEMIALYDADHRPALDCLLRGSARLRAGLDCVQGRCAVRNGGETRLARMVAIEFEAIYGVGHPAWARSTDTAVFCGTNAYFKAPALRRLSLNKKLQTEDIDWSMRAWQSGLRIGYDDGLIATELATTTLDQLWHQRARWSRGWMEVTLRHQGAVLKSEQISGWRKVSLTLLLGYRELNAHLSLALFPLLVAYALTGTYDAHAWQGLFWTSFAATQLAGPVHTWAAWRRRAVDLPQRSFIMYALLAPFYTLFKSAIGLVAAVDVLRGARAAWVVTPRSMPEESVGSITQRLS
jgi:cellulose synthase/poly-beta-1,6-N-acetylglucosamine synthase-like glycosyltransferase